MAHKDREHPNLARRTLLKAPALLIATPPAALAAKGVGTTDPVFSAIAAHKAVDEQLAAAAKALDEVGLRTGWAGPEYQAAERAFYALPGDRAELDAFMMTVPVTLPGALAYIEHLGSEAAFGGCMLTAQEAELALSVLAISLRGIIEGGAHV